MFFLIYLPLSVNLKAEKTLNQGLKDQAQDIIMKNRVTQSSGKPQKKVPPQLESEDFLNHLDKLASEHKVRIVQVSQDIPRKNGDLSSVDLNLALEGEKQGISDFLKNIENQSRLFAYSSWQAVPQGQTLKLTLRLTLYAGQ